MILNSFNTFTFYWRQSWSVIWSSFIVSSRFDKISSKSFCGQGYRRQSHLWLCIQSLCWFERKHCCCWSTWALYWLQIDPSPENVPWASNDVSHNSIGLVLGQHWNWNGICQHKNNTQKKEAVIFSNWSPQEKSIHDLILFSMTSFVKNTIISRTNASLKQAGETETSSGEFLLLIGLWSWSKWLVILAWHLLWSRVWWRRVHQCTGLVGT